MSKIDNDIEGLLSLANCYATSKFHNHSLKEKEDLVKMARKYYNAIKQHIQSQDEYIRDLEKFKENEQQLRDEYSKLQAKLDKVKEIVSGPYNIYKPYYTDINEMFKEELKKCHICGNIDYDDARANLSEEEFEKLDHNDKLSELINCSQCDELVCDQDSCREELNDGDDPTCKTCISKWTLYDCEKCKSDECPFNRVYSTCYECPEYTEVEVKDDENKTTDL